jgi:hypothetical protein
VIPFIALILMISHAPMLIPHQMQPREPIEIQRKWRDAPIPTFGKWGDRGSKPDTAATDTTVVYPKPSKQMLDEINGLTDYPVLWT